MPVPASTDILMLSNTQARELAGRAVTIGGVKYSFQDYDPGQPGQPPWRSGAEGKAYPLVGQDGVVTAYLKFFTRPTKKRLNRTAWLIGQQMHTWLPSLAAAPVLWTDTRYGLHGAKIDFQFAAYLAKAVPGETWLECKSGIADGKTRFAEDMRWRCVTDLLLALAALERAELVHGDLSPNNVIIDLNAQPDKPALYLIDFDAFFASAAGANQAVTVGEGGTYGTDGYCPPDLAAAVSAGDGSAAPYSDRYGRDMLILEFLLMGSGLPADDPLEHWNREQVQLQFAAWQARSDRKLVQSVRHLDPVTVFTLSEPERPSSVDLATGLGLSLPERRVLRRVTELPRPAHAMLGYRPTVAKVGGGSRKPPIKPFYRGGRGNKVRSQIESRTDTPSLQALVAVAVVAVILLFFIAIVDMAWRSTPPTAGGIQKTAVSEIEKDRGEAKRGSPETKNGNPEAEPARLTPADLLALHQKVLPSLVTINVGHGRGTGFVIDGGLVVTAYHVVSPGQKAIVVFPDGEHASVVEHVAFDTARDLAVLRTDSKQVRQPLKLAASLPAIGAQVAAFKLGGGELQGVVTGIGKRKIPGEVAGCDILQTTLNAVPGWSGGPVVNMAGEVVGINRRTDGPLFESQGLKIATGSAAVPVTVLQPLLEIVRLTQAIQLEPTNSGQRRDRAALYFSNRDFDKAIADYTELIRLQPEEAEAYFSRGKAYAERGEFEKAADDYTKVIALKEDFVEAYRGRAAAREKRNDLDGAIADYLELIRLLPKTEASALEPRLVEMYKNRAKTVAGIRDFDKAIADLSAVIGLRPKDSEARAERARLYDAKGESDQAIADYTEAIRLEPKQAEWYNRRGFMRAVKGDHNGAIDDFTAVIRLKPEDAEAYCARGAVHGGRHEFKKAIADFTEAIRLDQFLAKAYYDRGSAYKAQGDVAKAEADFDQARKLGYRPE